MNAIVKLLFAAILITHGLRSAAFAQTQSPDQKACANATGVVCDPGHPLAGKSRPNLSTIDYTTFLDANGLADIHPGGARLGMTRSGVENAPPQVQAGFFDAINAIGAAGSQILDLDDGGCVDATGAALTNCKIGRAHV